MRNFMMNSSMIMIMIIELKKNLTRMGKVQPSGQKGGAQALFAVVRQVLEHVSRN